MAFHERLRAGFLAIAKAEPERCALVHAEGSIEEVEAQVWEAVEARLAVHG
jgi:dTMP kinase